jgi:hypothetical protein
MSLLGKILLAVNLLAAAGLAYLTLQSWSKRQEVSALALRYQLTLVGMPVDEPKGITPDSDSVAVNIEDAPGHVAETASKKMLTAHFGGEFPRTQLEAVKALQTSLRSNVAGQPNDIDKLRVLCGGVNAANVFEPGLLMRFAETFEERQAIRELAYVFDPLTGKMRMIANPQQIATNLSEGYRRLDRKFETVLNAPNPAAAQADAQKVEDLRAKIAAGDKKAEADLTAFLAEGGPSATRDEADRRQRIAQLLMLSDPSAANQKKTVLTVGLRTYALALNEQLGRTEEIVRRVERQIEQDQAKYQDEYELLKQMAVQEDQLLAQQTQVVQGYLDQAAEDDKHVSVRQTQLANLEKDLAEVTKTVSDLLQAQAGVEKALFEVQKKVGDTLKKNTDLETNLLKAEDRK